MDKVELAKKIKDSDYTCKGISCNDCIAVNGFGCCLMEDKKLFVSLVLAEHSEKKNAVNNFIKIRRHEVSNAYLNLDDRNYTDYVINVAQIKYAEYDENYTNGYGQTLSYLRLLVGKDVIFLYRKDADDVWEQINKLVK